MFRRLLILILMVLCIPCAAGSFLPPVAVVRAQPPQGPFVSIISIAGAPPQNSYHYSRSEPAITGFVSFHNDGLPSQQTNVRLSYDNTYLFVEFHCRVEIFAAISGTTEGHDGPIWRDDSVEILLDPERDRKDVFHLVANCFGVRYEEQGRTGNPESWNGPWHTSAGGNDTEWSVLCRIPFTSLGVPIPKTGDVWEANFCRHDVEHNELSSWSPVLGGFAEPEWFGQIVFGGSQAPIITVAPLDIGAPGTYEVTAKVSNAGGGPLSVRCAMLVDGKPLVMAKPLEYTAPKGDTEWKFSINYPLEGQHKLSLQFTDSEGKVIMRTAPAAVSVPEHRSQLNRFREIVRGLIPPPAIADGVKALKGKLGGLVAFGKNAEGSREKWADFGRRLDAIEPEVARVRYTCADSESNGYCIGTETSLTKIIRDRFFNGEVGEPLRISTARNEHESAQLVVLPYGKALEGVEVSISALEGPGGAVISPDRLALNLVDYVRTRQPKYDIDYVGWWPDPLMPMKPFDVPQGSLQPIWLTVHPSEQTPAGTYRGTVTIKPKNASESSFPIEVKVWDFTLPLQPHLKTAFALFEHEIGAWYGGMTEEIKRNYYAFMLDHRLNVVNIYSCAPIPRKEDMPFCAERGQNFLTLAYTHNKDQKGRDELAAMIREYQAFLKSNGWGDMASIYGFDEVKPDKYGELRDMYGWLKKEFPDLPRMCTVAPTDELKGSVDIWVPLTSNYIEKDARAFEKSGDEVWWYVCCVPPHPYPNFFIDYPAIDQRIIFWMNWKYRIPGFLYYAVNLWEVNRKSKDRWPEVEWDTLSFDEYNGDGQLLYPGPDGKPISSIRLECIRDGIEDYDYFAILDELVKKSGPKTDKALLETTRKLLAIDEAIVGSPSDYTLDPALILRTRQEVAETIEQLKKPSTSP